MIYQFIFEKQLRYSIGVQCRVLGVSRAGYYRWRRQDVPKRQRENHMLLQRTQVLYAQYRKRYGSPRLTRVLQAEGYHCSRNRVARLMRDHGLVARSRRRWVRTTVSDHRAASPNLLARDQGVGDSTQGDGEIRVGLSLIRTRPSEEEKSARLKS